MTPRHEPARTTVLALHRQVNVVRARGLTGPMLAEPVARSAVLSDELLTTLEATRP